MGYITLCSNQENDTSLLDKILGVPLIECKLHGI
ncbi:UNVERIFIED_ORG: hypothetical protein ABIC97_002769 [Peribacillus simplex]